jgi:hypothetical protein
VPTFTGMSRRIDRDDGCGPVLIGAGRQQEGRLDCAEEQKKKQRQQEGKLDESLRPSFHASRGQGEREAGRKSPVLIGTIPNAGARSASAPTIAETNHIIRGQLVTMSTATVRWREVVTATAALSVLSVIAGRSQVQVIRVYARRVIAAVKNPAISGNGSVCHRPRQTVCEPLSERISSDLTVTVRSTTANPNPTVAVAPDVIPKDVRVKLNERLSHHKRIVARRLPQMQ